MVKHFGNLEVIKDKQKHKKIVDTQGLFQQISCQKIKCGLRAFPKINNRVEGQGQPNPKHTPTHRFLKLDFPIVSMKQNKIKKQKKKNGEIKDNAVIYTTAIQPPYYDLAKKTAVGKVSLINIVDSKCDKCSALDHLVDGFQQAGVAITEEKTFEYDSKEGKELIKQFALKSIPSLLLSTEVDNYAEISKGLAQSKLKSKDGFYSIQSTFPPYRDLEKNSIVGLVDIILLGDKSCTKCYDVNLNKQVLNQFGVTISTEKSVDINSKEGEALKTKYKIIKVPVLLMSPEVKVYDSLMKAWKNVGSVEDDGWYVMRKPEVIGTYQDLEKKEVVEANG